MHSNLYGAPDHGNPKVFAEVVGPKFQVLYKMALLHIYGHEVSLKSGRFSHFSQFTQEWEVPITLDAGRHTISSLFEVLINWIAERSEQRWSLRVEMDTVASGAAVFSFADPELAMLFLMTWQPKCA